MSVASTGACDWCLKVARVQTIEEKLWRFWGVISDENPSIKYLKNICEECASRYERFLTYIERCKSNECVIKGLPLKSEPSIDICHNPLIKQEILEEEELDSDHRTVPDGQENSDKLNSSAGDEADNLKATFVCPYCEKAFMHSSSLSVHLRFHTGDKPFACPYCRKRFYTSSHLNAHKEIHTGNKPFRCTHCDKSFSCSSVLRRHLRVHTDDTFKCDQCDRAFVQTSHLKAHLRIHSGDRPFRCTHCDKSFSKTSDLKRHLRVHTGERPFRCPRCDKGFLDSSALKKHARVHGAPVARS